MLFTQLLLQQSAGSEQLLVSGAQDGFVMHTIFVPSHSQAVSLMHVGWSV